MQHDPGCSRPIQRPPCCHPADCQCERCRGGASPCPCTSPCGMCAEKPYPFPPKGFLLPHILASERLWLRRHCAVLELQDLPDCVSAPLTLTQVRIGCPPVAWEILSTSDQRRLCLALTLPLDCQVRDANGCTYTAHAMLPLEAAMRLTFPACECWRNSLSIFPCVRLVQCASASCDTSFQAELEVLAELYMTRWEPCMVGVPKPVCPELPLYPQPRIP